MLYMVTNDLLYKSTYITYVSQILTTLLDVYALSKNYTGDNKVIQGLIQIEFGVQFIEMVFYSWLIFNFANASKITEKRYYDWVITTPSMLFVFITYLDFIRNGEKVPINSTNTIDYLQYYLQKHGQGLYFICVMNILMLLLGYLGELKMVGKIDALVCGFVPFLLYFYYIYAYVFLFFYFFFFYFLFFYSFLFLPFLYIIKI